MTVTRTRVATAAALLASAALLGTAATASAAPSLWVSQTAGLSTGQAVSVSLNGIDGSYGSVAIGQCKAVVAGPADCNLVGSLIGRADDGGAWRSNAGSAVTVVGAVGGVDCLASAGACMIAVTSLNNPSAILATAPLSFG
ncbi:neocarzinostatin apoprotein domain-containing protein [Nocardia takedensis]|uniref:neocarzinostatin apoprotein domain-containing protein n=1 Tax=Nocardia takedensis TaxID=259390 RepID=UPI00031BDB5D|nr:neocarzinostatin apoprotein domain-containing protein [Nocardia takedensis]